MPVFNLNDLVRIGAKFFLLVSLLALIQFLINFLISQIPAVNIPGCAGYYFEALGIAFGLKLMLSIVVYGFTAKFVLNFLSHALE